MDDILVNFDDERTGATLEALVKLASRSLPLTDRLQRKPQKWPIQQTWKCITFEEGRLIYYTHKRSGASKDIGFGLIHIY